jgi:hypothetical protein
VESRPTDTKKPTERPTDEATADEATTTEEIAPEDLAAADEILFSHPPLHVARHVCACGEEYPCSDVRWALRVNSAALRTGVTRTRAGATP